MLDAASDSAIPWLTPALTEAITRQVSGWLGAPWRIVRTRDCSDNASHPAAILAGDSFAAFVKLGYDALAADRFRREADGLHLLRERAGVQTPACIGVVSAEGAVALLLEAVQELERGSDFWPQLGRTLAQLHGVTAAQFGLSTDCYWGDLHQDNTQATDWVEFFWTRRLAPRLRAAVDTGNLPPAFIAPIERIGARLPELCGPAVTPALLHGDAHKNNFLATPRGPVLIDPSVHYGHPEMDLAYIDFFEPVPADVLAAYAEVAPLAPGFAARRELWRLPARLAMVEVGGPAYLDKLDASVRHYESSYPFTGHVP